MAKLLIKIRIDLSCPHSGHRGAIFHRWLPDGGKNSISLNVRESNTKLKVWFERCGYTGDDFIHYDEKRREVDPQIMSRQGCLYSGPLFGLLAIDNIPAEELQAVKGSKVGDENYAKLAKRIVKESVYQPVHEFIEIIRIKFGQYWIKELPKWDSRFYSLGYYCSHILGMQWTLDNGKTWQIFDPDKPDTPKAKFYAPPSPDYLQFLTKDDWESIPNSEYTGKNSDIFLIRSHQLCEEGNLRLAFIEGVTALDLAVHDFIRNRASSDFLSKSAESFYNLPLRTQLTILCTTFGSLLKKQIERSVKAIDLRNQIVHHGLEPKDDDKELLYSLLHTVSHLSKAGVSKFPSSRFHRVSVPEENWAQYYKK